MLQFAATTRFIVVDEYRPVRDRERNDRKTEDGRPLMYVAALVIGGSKKPLMIRVKVPAPKPVPLGSLEWPPLFGQSTRRGPLHACGVRRSRWFALRDRREAGCLVHGRQRQGGGVGPTPALPS